MNDAGLIRHKGSQIMTLPGQPIVRKQRAMARKKFLRLERNMRFSQDLGLLSRFLCTDCKTPVQIRSRDHLLKSHRMTVDIKHDNFELSCACSVWTVKA